jgi:uncharacterized protein
VTPEPGAVARPIGSRERLALIDVVRGFALGGVFVSNVNVWFSGKVLLPKPRLEALNAATVDVVFGYLFGFLVSGKLVTIFSLLFGFGFAVHLLRAEERGGAAVGIYARRLGVLLGIGVAHMLGLWYGDILNMYALLGFALLLFRRRSDRALLFWGFALTLASPFIVSTLEKFLPVLLTSAEAAEAAAKAAKAEEERVRALTLAGFEGASYLAAMRVNAVFLVHDFWTPSTLGSWGEALGKFLLGFYAGRRRLFHEPEEHLPLFRRLLLWGLVAGVLGNGFLAVVRYLTRSQRIPAALSWGFLLRGVGSIAHLGLALFYIAAMTLLFRRPAWRRLLSALAPAGRMALTNYLSQTVIALLLFDGFGLGLIGKLPNAKTIGLTSGLFVAQMLLSHLWLSRFRFGPAEWVWRSLTYGRPQPMRLDPAEAEPSPKGPANPESGST